MISEALTKSLHMYYIQILYYVQKFANIVLHDVDVSHRASARFLLFHIGSVCVCAARRTANMRTAKTPPPPPPSPPPPPPPPPSTPPRLRQSDFQTIFGWFAWRVVRVAFVLGSDARSAIQYLWAVHGTVHKGGRAQMKLILYLITKKAFSNAFGNFNRKAAAAPTQLLCSETIHI